MNTIILYFYSILTKFIPEARCFDLKCMILLCAGVKIDKNVRICSSVKVIGDGFLAIGSDTWVGPNTMISVSKPASLTIGNNVDIAPCVYIGTGSHVIDMDGSNSAGKGYNDNIVIQNGVWIGVGAIILPGVNIGNKAVVGEAVHTHYESAFLAIFYELGIIGLFIILFPVIKFFVKVLNKEVSVVSNLLIAYIISFFFIFFIAPGGLHFTSLMSIFLVGGFVYNYDIFLISLQSR